MKTIIIAALFAASLSAADGIPAPVIPDSLKVKILLPWSKIKASEARINAILAKLSEDDRKALGQAESEMTAAAADLDKVRKEWSAACGDKFDAVATAEGVPSCAEKAKPAEKK